MEVTGGALSYQFVFDISQGEASIEKIKESFEAMGFSAEDAGKMADELATEMTDSLQRIADSATNAEDAVSQIRDKANELRDSVEDMDDSMESVKANVLADSLDAVGDAVEEDVGSFDTLTETLEDTGQYANISSIAIKALTSVTGKASTATKVLTIAQNGLNKAMRANPYAAIVIGLFSAIAALTKYATSQKNATTETKAQNKELEHQLELLGRLVLFNNELHASTDKAAEQQIEYMRQSGATLEKIRKAEDRMMFDENMRLKENRDILGGNIEENLKGYDKRIALLRKEIGDYRKSLASAGTAAEEDSYMGSIKRRQEEIDRLMEISAPLRQQLAEEEAIRNKHNTILANRAKEDHEIRQKEIADRRAQTDAVIAQMRDGYSKRAAEIRSGREKEREELQARLDDPVSGLSEDEKSRIRNQIRESRNIEAAELAEVYREQKEAITKAQQDLQEAEYEIVQGGIDRRNEQRQAEIDLMQEGTTKEIAQMRLDHDRRLVEIERAAREEAEAMAEANKQKWLNEQTAKGRSVSDADWYASSAYKALNGGLTEEQRAEIDQRAAERTTAQNALYAKQQKDLWQQMLQDYGDYTALKEAIDKRYFADYNAAALAYLKATTDEERKTYSDLMQSIKKEWAKADFGLAMDTIDATAYATVDERMDAINKAYDEYIEKLGQAGASEAEINNALLEKAETTGKIATLNEQINELTRQRNALDVDDPAQKKKIEELNKEIERLQKELDRITKKQGSNGFFDDFFGEDKVEKALRASEAIGDVMSNIGDAMEDKVVKGIGDFIGFASKIGMKIKSGDYLGAALDIITSIGNAIAEDIAKVRAFEKANAQAAQTANQINIDNLLQGHGSIFGDDAVAQLANYIEAADKAGKALAQLGVSGGKTFKTLDRSAFANFFGGSDKYSSLADFARRNGMELYDEYGNLNAQVLALFKDTYEDLTEADKQWIDNAIAYTDQYAEAMEGLASYMESIFGNTVSTIVDQIFDGAVDIKAITADVGKQMAKDLMQTTIMSTYFDGLKEQMTAILKAEGGMTDKASAEIFALYSQAMAAFENDLPHWQELAEKYQDAFDFDTDAESIGAGTALASASQESIDLMNGQLNAMRTVQGRIDNTINNILLEMRGFRGDMNQQWQTNHGKLDQIIENTSTSGLSRSLGAYFG